MRANERALLSAASMGELYKTMQRCGEGLEDAETFLASIHEVSLSIHLTRHVTSTRSPMGAGVGVGVAKGASQKKRKLPSIKTASQTKSACGDGSRAGAGCDDAGPATEAPLVPLTPMTRTLHRWIQGQAGHSPAIKRCRSGQAGGGGTPRSERRGRGSESKGLNLFASVLTPRASKRLLFGGSPAAGGPASSTCSEKRRRLNFLAESDGEGWIEMRPLNDAALLVASP